MGIGPFDSFSFPGVYTRTLTEPPKATAAGDIRVPAFIGVTTDTIPVNNFEMFRGSSSMADNHIVGEDVSAQFTGSNRNFTVSIKPIVKGDGSGTVTNDPKTVTVLINNNPVPVASVNGTTGEIYLVNIPMMGDSVLVNYYFKRTDTLHTNEDLTDQIDGTNNVFQTHYYPIVSGNNSGITTTDVTKVTVTLIISGVSVNVVPTEVNGDAGRITLASAPTSGTIIKVTYYTNDMQNTADILPSPYVASITSVGYAPGSTDFIQGTDYILDTTTSPTCSFNTIQWGNSFKIIAGQTTVGYTPFDSAQITGTLFDNRTYMRQAAGVADGTNKSFTMEFLPTDGQSRGTLTEDASKIYAYVGDNIAAALSNRVVIDSVNGSSRVINLKTAPDASKKVYVTEYSNILTTDSWVLDCSTAGAIGVGTYTLSGVSSGTAMSVVWNSHDTTTAVIKTEIPYADGTGASAADTQVLPGYAIQEKITLTFADTTSYTVASDTSGGTGSLGDNTGYLNQTYIDTATGFRVTLVTATYVAGNHIVYDVTPVFTTSAVPTRAVPGIKVAVSNTSGINPGDTGIVNTYKLVGAQEPATGDFYYVTFNVTKQFDANGVGTPIFYTQEKDIIAVTGPLSVDNKIGMAAHFAFLNGAPAVVLCQIKKTSGGTDAPDSRYIYAIDVFNQPMEGGLQPTLIQPVTTSSAVINYLKTSNSIQSGIRYSNEHRSYFGFPINTTPTLAQSIARGMVNERMVAVYPDGAITIITDALGNDTEYLMDGAYLAAAIAGRDTSPAFDVAEPMTKKPVVGFARLYRRLDAVTAAQTANAGITLVEEIPGGMQIKFALTTDTSSVLTRTPSIIRVKDFIQRGARSILTPYIGTKMLVQRSTEVESTLDSYLSSLQQAQIITAYQPSKATQDPADPSILNVQSFYSPVPELLWIMITFNLRSSV